VPDVVAAELDALGPGQVAPDAGEQQLDPLAVMGRTSRETKLPSASKVSTGRP
jgi:hypothetical protein